MIFTVKGHSQKRIFYVKNGMTYKIDDELPFFVKKDVQYLSQDAFHVIPYSKKTIITTSIVENPTQM
ncbi:MAG: hypothetical protein COX81_03305 [Candidatus Magasanikbacteria bacterium CG_4_10_14_0_2_um_filter_37_12]|uniref:Uncharacterized protein n=1 Tax=Candidatus Magasanikbacteria bacterium CG_4_10_14_0_2_um_filter_37_12 TaxID=1974637 RepID=A0A2M7V781_9BACT|nr:MAG: hypothetical protein COX81_03305 [Candidatus Magasanikbacteria bacterium CG_4_10_14_0_2_um_filter_37_12]